MRSLRRQLTLWLLLPLLLLWAVNARMTYQTAIDAANRVHDRTLLGSVLAIAERITVQDDEVIVDLPYSALEMLESHVQSRVYYRVSHADGQVITGYDDLPLPADPVPAGSPFYYDTLYRGDEVRIAVVAKRIYDERVQEPLLIQVAETAELRNALSRQILLSTAVRELLLILLAVTIMWLAINRGLQPLYRLRDQVHRRNRSDLRPIDAPAVPREVRPLIDAFNEHSARVTQVLSAQRRFVANAAHQLKTPLTLLRTQADFASRQDSLVEVREILGDLRQNTEEVSHLVDQLLALNRAESNSAPEFADLNLTDLARRTTFEWLPMALRKSIDLGFEGGEAICIRGHELMLHELLKNLLDNAMRFTPGNGHVTVRVEPRDGHAVLSVEDSGCGIPVHERERVFDRFYQIPGTAASSGGLGLAIVREIATLHDADIRLLDAPSGTGTLVQVEFPPARSVRAASRPSLPFGALSNRGLENAS